MSQKSREKLVKKLTKLLKNYEKRGEIVGINLQFNKIRYIWDGLKFEEFPSTEETKTP
jgi:hypothetical protein